jgi:DENN (AEX-3) domain
MLMQIFVSLLHERKVILILGGGMTGPETSGLTAEEDCCRNGAILIETLLSLLYPIQWNFTNISNLIPSMIDYLEAPFPYIVCVSRDLWRHIYEHRWQAELCSPGDEVIAFDLDA